MLPNDLAVVYKYAGRFDEAEALYWRALPIIETACGRGHVDVATIWHNLGGIEHARGRFATGENYVRRAVEIRQAALGSAHVAVAKDIAALAALVQAQHRSDEAERLYQRAIGIFENAFKPVHYELGVNYDILAALHAARGNHQQAQELYRRALEIETHLLGPRRAPHPAVLPAARRRHRHRTTGRRRAIAHIEANIGAHDRAALVIEPIQGESGSSRSGCMTVTDYMIYRLAHLLSAQSPSY